MRMRMAAAAVLLIGAACSDPAAPVRVQLDPVTAPIAVGASITLNVQLDNARGGVSWSSSAPAVASVSASGVVRGLAPGMAIITATSVDNTNIRSSVSVSVIHVPDTLPLIGLGAVPERYTGEVAVRGGWAYTSSWGNRGVAGNAVKVWNVAGATPVLVDSLRVPGATTTGDVQISDDGALLVVAVEHNPNGAIMIYSRADPARPDSLARFSSDNTKQGVHTVKLGRVGGRQYAFLSVNPGLQPARLVTVDITDPTKPVEVWSEAIGRPYVHDSFVRDGYLFTALWHDGLRIYDIGGAGRGGSPTAPVLLGSIPTQSGYIHNIWWYHDPAGSKKYVFLGEEGPASVLTNSSGDVHVIDISDVSAPKQVAQYGVQGAGTHNFSMDETSGVLYAAYYNGGVRAIDVRGDLSVCDATQRNQRGFCDLGRMGREMALARPPGAYIWGVMWQDGRVYASDMRAGLYVFDASSLRR